MPPETETQEAPAQEPVGIHAALARAREMLQNEGTLVPEETEDEQPEIDQPGEGGAEADGDGDEDESPEADDEGSEEHGSEQLDDDDDADDEESDDVEESAFGDQDEEEGEEEGEEEEAERFTASLPGRGPDDDDVEIEVDDQATADRINQLRNGYMRGEAYRTGLAEIQAAQEELHNIEESFAIDPAGFMIDNLEGDENIAKVALALLVQPGAWGKLKPVLEKLVDDASELRTVQAEAKAARLETRDALRASRAQRKAQNENAAVLRDAIDSMVPDDMSDGRRQRIIQDMTRDVVDHINRHKLESLQPRDLPTILADRLELNGIDPLEARDAVKNGKRTQSKPSTRKKSKGKPKSGKQLVKASAKRKKVAAAPGAGKKAAPVAPKKLPEGANVQDTVKALRKSGGIGQFLRGGR